MPATISRAAYAERFGPTVGDRVRLADTSLVVQVERDLTTYGEEVIFGAGGVVRDGMGQGQTGWAEGAPDTVITNALILDHTGIVKADVSIRDGVIGAIGKAGNPAIQPGVTIPIGPGTEIIAGEGRILTAGGVDTQVHFVSPQQIEAALAAGITTMLGGGTGPTAGTFAAASTPGAWHIGKMIDAADGFAMNLGFAGKGSASAPNALVEQIAGGACALTLDADWGAMPTTIGCCLTVADEHDVQAVFHADAMDEAGPLEATVGAFAGRTVVAALASDAGRCRAADLAKLAGLPNVLASSTRAFASDQGDGRLDEWIAADGILHDAGALAMMRSGRPTGRAGDVIIRTWQTADAMKRQRGPLQGDGSSSDNMRAKRFIAKYTINPAITYGIADHVGSVEIGKLADLVVWSPAFFGVRPDLVLKGGTIAAAAARLSDAVTQPVHSGPMFGACAGARVGACLTFVAQSALDKGLPQRLRTQRRLVAVRNTRGGLSRQSMILNDSMPDLTIDPKTHRVAMDGEPLRREPPKDMPLAQRYSLF